MSGKVPRGNREYVRYQLENDLPNFDVKFSPQFQKIANFQWDPKFSQFSAPKSRKRCRQIFHNKISNFSPFLPNYAFSSEIFNKNLQVLSTKLGT